MMSDWKMARPSVASLNLLAHLLREAQPLYAECGSILNYIDPAAETMLPQLHDFPSTAQSTAPTNKDAAVISLTVFEPSKKRLA